jgi:DNA helicase-2/ATP-dependent DNA helicase PcrA
MVARQSGLLNELKADTTIEGQGRLENFNSLLDSIKEYVENDLVETDDEKNISNYLQTVSLYTDADDEKNDTDYVSLMSVHAAKGLEFKSVFVVGLEEKLFPSFMSMNSTQELDEERRLFYVAITRAKQLLTLTYSNSRYKFGQLNYNDPSRFISEINESHLDSNVNSMKGNGAELVSEAFGSLKSSIKGNFKPIRQVSLPKIDISNFVPSPSENIAAGMKVLHLKFGEGIVLGIEGGKDNRIATIHFSDLNDEQEKKIMLKFAKLQIVE